MRIRKVVVISAGTLMLVTNFTPIFADEVSYMNTNATMQICEDSIDDSAGLIEQYLDGIQIENVQADREYSEYDEVTVVEQPVVYNYVEEKIPVEETMTVDELMAMYESMMQEVTVPVDTTAEHDAYDAALANYNSALAEYEAASQMIETSKDIEVEVVEEVTDENGNVSILTRTEIQTVTEMVPAGDVALAQANLDAAKAELEAAGHALDTAPNQTVQEVVVDETNEVQEMKANESIQVIEDEISEITPTTEISQSEVKSKLDSLIIQYQGSKTWPTFDDHANYGWSCYNFAHFVFNTIFDRKGTVGSYSTGTEYKFNYPASDVITLGTIESIQSDSELEALLEKAAPGDYIQVRTKSFGGGPHSAIVAGVDAVNNIIGIFDAYSNGGDYARHYSETFSQFKNNNYGVSIYRFKDYITDAEAVHIPVGKLESIQGSDGTFTVKGWAYDPDETSTSIKVLVYLGGREDDSNAKSFTVTANKARSDVNKAKGITGNHGFEVTLTTDKTGLQPVYAYGVNIKEGKNAIFGESKVTIYEKMNGYLISDVPKDAWYHDTVKECYETGLISGTSATTFSPNQNITRGMIVTILWRMQGQPKVAFNGKFKDVKSNQWYSIPISWAEKTGVVHGYGDGTFKPDAAVTREQVAVMLANYAGYRKVYKASSSSSLTWYSDYSEISSWAVPAMSWAVSNNIIYGGIWRLYPKDSATRAEGAAMILRFKNLLK